MSALAAFCTLVVEFFEDISEQYPEERDIATAASAAAIVMINIVKNRPSSLSAYRNLLKAIKLILILLITKQFYHCCL